MTFIVPSSAAATATVYTLLLTRQATASASLARRSFASFASTTPTSSKNKNNNNNNGKMISSMKTSLDASKSSSSSTSSFSTSSSDDNTSNSGLATGSRRGQQAVQLLPSYLADARAVETYHPITAPNGALQLGVAESQLVEDLLVPKINALVAAQPFTADCIYYQPTAGRPAFRTAMASYIEDLTNLTTSSSKKLDVEGLVVGAGCNAVLENLCFALAEPGDTVLIPTPYYAAFEFDLVARAGLQVHAVTTFEHSGVNTDNKKEPVPVEAYYPTPAALDAAYDQAPTKPKILLLSHPHNPLGIAYPPHVVQDCIDWCRAKQVHLISDEIYAGSVYRADEANFVSALELASQSTTDDDDKVVGLGIGPYIHWVYALSKDFALSGLRVGVVYSENADIRMPLQKLNDMCQISSQTQVLVEGMMTARESKGTADSDERWTTVFRREHHARLRARGDRLHAILEEFNIPHLPAACGLFCWMDLSQFLAAAEDDSSSDAERERTLYMSMVQDFGLLFTPGLSMRNERPGFFRCVFSAASDDEYELALTRLRTFLTTKQQ